jgi:succinate dehydrogenase/fumarate reductase cytochrome b subunit
MAVVRALYNANNSRETTPRRSAMIKLIIVAFLVIILFNLGAGLYYMMSDKGKSDRMVKALTWRIGISVALILLVMLGIFTGVIRPHDLGR